MQCRLIRIHGEQWDWGRKFGGDGHISIQPYTTVSFTRLLIHVWRLENNGEYQIQCLARGDTAREMSNYIYAVDDLIDVNGDRTIVSCGSLYCLRNKQGGMVHGTVGYLVYLIFFRGDLFGRQWSLGGWQVPSVESSGDLLWIMWFVREQRLHFPCPRYKSLMEDNELFVEHKWINRMGERSIEYSLRVASSHKM